MGKIIEFDLYKNDKIKQRRFTKEDSIAFDEKYLTDDEIEWNSFLNEFIKTSDDKFSDIYTIGDQLGELLGIKSDEDVCKLLK